MRYILSCLLFLFSSAALAEQYIFAQYGTARLDVSDPHIVEARLSSGASAIGVGYKFNENWSAEFGFHDFGTYRIVAEETATWSKKYTLGPFSWTPKVSITVPGYVEARAYGQSLGVKYQSDYGVYVKGAIVYTTAEAELHSAFKYDMETHKGLLPLGEVGVKWGNITVGYSRMPKMSVTTVGVQVSF